MSTERDHLTKAFLSRNDIFADIVNCTVFHGQQMIKPNDLQEQDPIELISWADKNGKTISLQRTRDILKQCIIKTSEKVTFILFGIENQSEVHYAMAIRNMLYDALNYAGQVEEISKKNRAEGYKNSKEFLSGLRKTDKLQPVITITVYWKGDNWDGARNLVDMLDIPDPRYLNFINDYSLNLVVPAEANTEKFHTSMKLVMQAIAASEDKKRLLHLMESDKNFRSMENDAARLICTFMNVEMPFEKEGTVDMCKAIRDLIEEVEAETTKRVEAETAKRVEAETTKRVEAETTKRVEAEGIQNSVKALISNLNFTLDQALDALGITGEKRAEIITSFK